MVAPSAPPVKSITQSVTWSILVWVAIGGGFGAVGRYSLGGWATAMMGEAFPWGTLLVNVLGSCVLGVVAGMARAKRLSVPASSFLAAGFCGGFTTFSAFDLETYALLSDARYTAAFLYVSSSVLMCLVGVALGLRWVRPGSAANRPAQPAPPA